MFFFDFKVLSFLVLSLLSFFFFSKAVFVFILAFCLPVFEDEADFEDEYVWEEDQRTYSEGFFDAREDIIRFYVFSLANLPSFEVFEEEDMPFEYFIFNGLISPGYRRTIYLSNWLHF